MPASCSCGGKGEIYNDYLGIWEKCPVCNGSRVAPKEGFYVTWTTDGKGNLVPVYKPESSFD